MNRSLNVLACMKTRKAIAVRSPYQAALEGRRSRSRVQRGVVDGLKTGGVHLENRPRNAERLASAGRKISASCRDIGLGMPRMSALIKSSDIAFNKDIAIGPTQDLHDPCRVPVGEA